MASKNSQQPKKVELNINDMNLYQINAIKQQLDQEIEILEKSIVDLHNAKTKFVGCYETVESFDKLPNDNQIMVPLTPSLYVPGRTVNNNEFLLDIGTGYYIERDRKSTIDYFNRKVQFLNTQMDKIVKSMQEKSAVRQSCLQRQQQLIMAQIAAQQQQQQSTATGQPKQIPMAKS
ncbi:Prefoldin subunit 5 [Dermatophagoides pteronyssinus]|uniref:Prefoldin subunit 5 n=1 Tax=Dermatophagoides pteronyssinus TaxID=6956 RepID=A0ABQ8JLU1_DERPT|nr:Prefoldin subunit 5 [Dermatophagoides pteronyssinus]